MTSPALPLLLVAALTVPAFSAPPADAPVLELTYQGKLSQDDRNGDILAKKFSVYVYATQNDNNGKTLFYALDENGGGGWDWPESYGQLNLGEGNSLGGKAGIQIRHDHNETDYPLTIPQPFFPYTDKLEPEATWVDGKYRYTVTRQHRVSGYSCYEVEITTNFGRSSVVSVEQSSGLLIRGSQRLFMGRGDRFDLTMELESHQAPDETRQARLTVPVKSLLDLQTNLKREQNAKPELSTEQLKLAETQLVALRKQSAGTPLDTLARTIQNDVETQLITQEGVQGLVTRYVGRKISVLKLKHLDGTPVASDEHKDKIVLLHFWDYRREPLKEPYGQVGYLDFLNNQNARRKFDVKIYGVSTDIRLAQAETADKALRSARQLKEFFNLGYTITYDDGSLIKQMGDPRRIQAKLPLWVLLAPDGTIAHYSVGFYQIQPNQGLKELETEIAKLVRAQRAAD